MQDLKSLLNQKQVRVSTKLRARNTDYEEALEFAEYVGLPTKFVLSMIKQYGKPAVLNLRTWLYDYPNIRNKMALLKYRLKSDKV